MCADISTDTTKKMNKKRQKKWCYVSHVTSHVSHVTCHLSLTLTATATNHPLAKFLIIHSRLVCKIQKPEKYQQQKIIEIKKEENGVMAGQH